MPQQIAAVTVVVRDYDQAIQRERIGDQAGGRVFLFLQTDDFAGDYARYVAAGVHFVEGPRTEPYGTVAVFEDALGNRWDLIEPSDALRGADVVKSAGGGPGQRSSFSSSS